MFGSPKSEPYFYDIKLFKMGLDTSHNAWHGPYSSFNLWRAEICKQAELGDLKDYYGFGGDKQWDENHPLFPLLYHSDCDGEIKWEDCKGIADALNEILPKITDWYVGKTINFINGCMSAYEVKENIDFH
jgi:hypothetical protein